jgi:hypothetical protein
MVVHGLWIINKAGGLVFQRNYAGVYSFHQAFVTRYSPLSRTDPPVLDVCRDILEGLSSLTANEYLVLAGTLHGVHAITSKLSPTGKGSGVQVIEGEDFKLNIMLTLTGTSRDQHKPYVWSVRLTVRPHRNMTQVPSLCSSRHYPTRIPSRRFRKSMKLVSSPRGLVWLTYPWQ